jgi:hypothetical protein
MDDQVTAGPLVCAIPKVIVDGWLLKRFTELRRQLTETTTVLKPGMGPEDADQFEHCVEMIVREHARSFVEWCFNSLEPAKVDAMPKDVEYPGKKLRRLNFKTRHARVLTRFGNIMLFRATWRQGSRGRTIAPLEKIPGIEFGATPGAQDLVGRQIAAAGSSQSRCIEVIAERTGARIGPEKLRNLSSYLAEIMEPQREACQVKQLEEWIDDAVKHSKNLTLAVSRDGVSLGIAPFGNFEMASVATLSVHCDGQRLGTIYLACAPEDNQETLSRNFTSLLTTSQRTEWLKRVRKLLLEPGGWGRVMRSIAGMQKQHGINPDKEEDVQTAKRYLHRYRRFMNYSEYRSHGSPIGSGIVESACKQIVTERLKLSGMRWSHAGAQQILTLRSILLSQTWHATFKKSLIASPAVSILSHEQAL